MPAETGEVLTEETVAELVRSTLHTQPRSIARQTLTHSGNAVFRVFLADDRAVVLRVSPRPGVFAYTGHNLNCLRELGLPVQGLLGSGLTTAGGSFVILDWIHGRDLLYELKRLTPAQMTRIARQVTEFQKHLGSLPRGKAFGWAPIGKTAAIARWTDVFGASDTTPIPLDATPMQHRRGRLRALRASIEPYFASIEPICFLDDLTVKNVLVENGELTGIIDVDFVCYGDPLMSVGSTLAMIAADVGPAGDFYGQELIRCWAPTPEQERAIHFYASLWAVGMCNAAEDAGDTTLAQQLTPIADRFLREAEEKSATAEQMLTAEQLLERATDRHRAGALADARRLYQRALDRDADSPVTRFRLGVLEMQEGNLPAALSLVQQAVTASPEDARYPSGLAQVHAAMGQWSESAAAYLQVLRIDPTSVDAHFGLGLAMQSQGDYTGAILAYNSALRYQPDFADAHCNLGNCHKLRGDLQQAETAYRQALVINPKHAGARSNLGIVLQARGQLDAAIEQLNEAVALEPVVASHAVNLAAALCQQRQFDRAQTLLLQVLAREPGNADAVYNLGNALHGLGQLGEAAERYGEAVRIRPDYAEAWNNLGNVRKELGEFQSAAEAYESALRIRPEFVDAINNSACLLRTLGRLEEAEAVLREGISNHTHAALYDNLGNVLKDAGRLEEALEAFRKSLELDPTAAATHSNLAYSLSFQVEDGQPILEECLRWNQRHGEPIPVESRTPLVAEATRSLERVRVGYVSPDFREHCQALFTVPLLSNHDHDRFEIFCYSSISRPDHITRRLAGYADVWRDVRPLDDAALADQIRNDGIDILVDLTMHMADGRPLLFARKPAPVQVAWLAYPGTTGITAMDYRLSDPRLDPPGCFEQHYSETTVLLPDAFWCYDPLVDGPPDSLAVNALPALSRGHLTLGCLNNPCKLTDHTLRLWSGVMRSLPHARLLLMTPTGSPRRHLQQRMNACNLPVDRIDFVPHQPREKYLKTYHQIDLGLDTFPYNGHTTSLDSFWMGVPVITRVGKTCVGRGGLSQLFQLDLLELAADSDEAFVACAVELAGDLPRLAKLRRELRPRLQQSPLMDGPRFAANIESAYRRMWEALSPRLVPSHLKNR
jgi:predicted O-linked N-acetylglucosamine transferase (SPINDLY family)